MPDYRLLKFPFSQSLFLSLLNCYSVVFMASWGGPILRCFNLRGQLAQESLHQCVCLYVVDNKDNRIIIVSITDDHCRVKLSPIDGVAGSDYINANYLPVRVYELVDNSYTTSPHYRGTSQSRST